MKVKGITMYDILIKNGTVINGTGRLFAADVGIKNGKITAVSPSVRKPAKKIVDASGLCVTPGFIDFHSHNDRVLLNKAPSIAKITQGITTEVTGQCGLSAVPYLSGRDPEEKDMLLGKSDRPLPCLWKNYIRLLEASPLITNVIPLVGQGNIRSLVVGFENRPARKNEITRMKDIVTEIMETGCWGMSTGLIYPPGIFTPLNEIISLAGIVAGCGGIYTSHIRGEGETLFPALKEILSVGEKAGVPVHVAHMKATGPSNWNKTDRALRMLYEAREKGIDVTYDQYPYTASSTTATALLPPWMHEGGQEKLIAKLTDKAERKRARESIEKPGGEKWQNWLFYGPERIIINQVKSRRNRKYEGKNLVAIAEMTGRDPIESAFDLLVEEHGSVTMTVLSMCEKSVRRIMKQKIGFVGTDGLPGRRPHPRLWGTFTRILGKYVREEKVLTLDEAVYKFSRAPVEKLKLKGRGEIKEGNAADIVIFDADRVKDMATYENPNRRSKGIEYVLVNGKPAVEKGKLTGVRSGRLLLRGD